MVNTNQNINQKIFKENYKKIVSRFLVFLGISSGLFIGNELVDLVDQEATMGAAVATLLVWLGNTVYVFFKAKQKELLNDGLNSPNKNTESQTNSPRP